MLSHDAAKFSNFQNTQINRRDASCTTIITLKTLHCLKEPHTWHSAIECHDSERAPVGMRSTSLLQNYSADIALANNSVAPIAKRHTKT